MGSFLSAAAFAFSIFELLAFAKPPTLKRRYNFSLGGAVLRITPRLAGILHYIVLAISISLILFLLLALHELIGPFDAISRNRVNITLGFLWGPVFGIWVNSVLRHPGGKELSRLQVVAGIALTVLFVVGSFGNAVGSFIEKYADSLSGVKIGVAELSFANKGHGGTPGAASYSPAGTHGNSVESSLGLEYVMHLHDYFIEPDVQFMKEFFKISDTALERQLDQVRRFAVDYIEPPLSCLLEWQQTSDDALAIEDHLRGFANVYRRLRLAAKDPRLPRFGPELVQRSEFLVSDVDVASPVPFSCTYLQTAVSNPNWIKQSDVDQVAANREYLERPYLAITLAGLMAQVNQYQNAGSILSQWIAQHERTSSNAEIEFAPNSAATPGQWLNIRARSILAAFTEEWLRKDEASVNTRLRDEHLSNLGFLRRGLGNILSKVPAFENLHRKAGTELDPTYKENCKLEGKLWRRLYVSYASIELAYLQNTLVHASYEEKYAETTTAGLSQLLGFDFSCLDDPRLFRAQVLEAFSRNAFLYIRARGKKDSAEARNNRLKTALRAAEIGLEEVRNSRSIMDRRELSAKYSDRITANDAVSVQEALTSTKKLLDAVVREE
ncbi:hypothetical protein ABID59_001131 [Bradyrhizobium sp. S3.3.6]|uniref:hypothetical protein n=1 Tax=Bradyrhizobium sp. S3.3.6 TaxID=3156429 RepID=UPI0033987762